MAGKRKPRKGTLPQVVVIMAVMVLAVSSMLRDRSQSVKLEPAADEQPLSDDNATARDLISLTDIPAYDGVPFVELNDNIPAFTAEDLTTDSFAIYSELDSLGRCGPAYACLSKEMMPAVPREAHLDVRPSGWHTVKYPELIEDNYLYNRCHLIAYALTGENANEKNLITGTRYLNVTGMLPFEERTIRYLEQTEHHVLYRITPYFADDDLVARGVRMEAYSVEDEGAGLCFHVFCYNVQPGIAIDYATGESHIIP